MTEYQEWFKGVTGFEPHRWQAALGSSADAKSRLIRIPTGFGKTQGVVGAWAFHRLVRQARTGHEGNERQTHSPPVEAIDYRVSTLNGQKRN